MMSSYPLASWWHGDRKIIYLFAIYGLAAGVITYIDSTSDQDMFANISFSLNFLAFIMMMWVDRSFASPYGYSILSDPFLIIPYSVIAWSFIGLIGYFLIRMFRMGP